MWQEEETRSSSTSRERKKKGKKKVGLPCAGPSLSRDETILTVGRLVVGEKVGYRLEMDPRIRTSFLIATRRYCVIPFWWSGTLAWFMSKLPVVFHNLSLVVPSFAQGQAKTCVVSREHESFSQQIDKWFRFACEFRHYNTHCYQDGQILHLFQAANV